MLKPKSRIRTQMSHSWGTVKPLGQDCTLTLTLKLVGSLNTVRMASACACMSTSWISPGSRDSSPFAFFSFSARAAESAAFDAWRAGPGKLDTEAMMICESMWVCERNPWAVY